MCHHAVHLSFGNLVDIRIRNCGTDELLQHMTDSSRGIRRLSIVFSAYITMEGVGKVASKIPLLEDLEISYTPKQGRREEGEGDRFEPNDNRDAFAIAGTMHRLQNLQLFGNWLDHEGLHAILEGCPSLESLDLRQCIHLRPSKQYGWRVRCEEQIKNLRLPVDPIDDYEHIVIHRIVNRKYWEYMKDMMI
ncbi:PREDICTED: putative F-box/LRR-repeat protein 23-like [Fragaria vesca subsp. vesca]